MGVICVFQGRVFLLAHSKSVPDGQVDSQMAAPSPDPCLALVSAQLAPGAEQAGPRQSSGKSQVRGFEDGDDRITSLTALSHLSPLTASPRSLWAVAVFAAVSKMLTCHCLMLRLTFTMRCHSSFYLCAFFYFRQFMKLQCFYLTLTHCCVTQ